MFVGNVSQESGAAQMTLSATSAGNFFMGTKDCANPRGGPRSLGEVFGEASLHGGFNCTFDIICWTSAHSDGVAALRNGPVFVNCR